MPRSSRMLLSAHSPRTKPKIQARTPATRLTCRVTSVPFANSGIAVSTMAQSIVTVHVQSPRTLHPTTGAAADQAPVQEWLRSAKRWDGIRQLHPEAKPLLLQRVDLSALLHLGDATVDEVCKLSVLLAEGVAVPVVLADVVDDREGSRLVAQHHAGRRHRVEHTVDAALSKR